MGNARSKRRKHKEFVRVQKQFDACYRRHKRKYIRDTKQLLSNEVFKDNKSYEVQAILFNKVFDTGVAPSSMDACPY